MNKSIYLIFGILLISMIGMVSAENIGTSKLGDDVEVTNYCSTGTCTYMNLSSIKYPNGTMLYLNLQMTKTNQDFNYTFSNANIIGDYTFITCGNPDGVAFCEDDEFTVSASGDKINSSQGFILLAMVGLIGLFFGLGRVFSEKKWKIKMGFDIIALLIGVVLTNSIRIIAAQSASLGKMGESLFIGVIAILSLMIAYMLIMMTIEVIQYFKKKDRERWEVDKVAY